MGCRRCQGPLVLQGEAHTFLNLTCARSSEANKLAAREHSWINPSGQELSGNETLVLSSVIGGGLQILRVSNPYLGLDGFRFPPPSFPPTAQRHRYVV